MVGTKIVEKLMACKDFKTYTNPTGGYAVVADDGLLQSVRIDITEDGEIGKVKYEHKTLPNIVLALLSLGFGGIFFGLLMAFVVSWIAGDDSKRKLLSSIKKALE